MECHWHKVEQLRDTVYTIKTGIRFCYALFCFVLGFCESFIHILERFFIGTGQSCPVLVNLHWRKIDWYQNKSKCNTALTAGIFLGMHYTWWQLPLYHASLKEYQLLKEAHLTLGSPHIDVTNVSPRDHFSYRPYSCALPHDAVSKWKQFPRYWPPWCREFTGHRWIPLSKASDAGLWFF